MHTQRHNQKLAYDDLSISDTAGQCSKIFQITPQRFARLNSLTVTSPSYFPYDWLGQFIGSYTASGTNQEPGGCDGNMDNVKLAHSLDMGVFCISPSDKGGQLYKPSKVCHDAVFVSRNNLFVADWLRLFARVLRPSTPSRDGMFLSAHTLVKGGFGVG